MEFVITCSTQTIENEESYIYRIFFNDKCHHISLKKKFIELPLHTNDIVIKEDINWKHDQIYTTLCELVHIMCKYKNEESKQTKKRENNDIKISELQDLVLNKLIKGE